MRVLGLVMLLAAYSVTGFAENSVDLSANDDAVRVGFGWTIKNDRLALEGNWLHHQDAGDVVGLTANVVGFATSDQSPVKAGVGGKLVYTNVDNSGEDGMALAPGGFLSYDFPSFNRFTIYGHIYYAPNVLSFSDTKQYRDSEVRLIYKVIEDADVFLGVRNVHVKYDDGHVDFDTGMNVGLRIRF